MKIEIRVNGENRVVECGPLTRLLDLLRGPLRLKGCKEGCGEGECGVCSVIMDGLLVNACMIPAMQAAGSSILTIEGLAVNGAPNPLQQAFINEGAVHCGFCTPGMILAAHALLLENPEPDLMETRVALSGNLCRCTGYSRIHAAVRRAVEDGCRPVWPSGEQALLKKEPEFSASEKDCFFRPATLDEALDILERHPDLLLLSGGTDTGPEMKSKKLVPKKALDIFSLPELKRIALVDGAIRIGSACTDAEIMRNDLIAGRLPALAEAASLCAAPAVRNRATIGGNLCTASGAADLPVALLALDAMVRVRGKGGERTMPVAEFIKGYREVDLKPGELLLDIAVPLPGEGAQGFYKRGSRAALTLSRVSLSMCLCLDRERITKARAACGSMSPVPMRMPGLEAALTGMKLDDALIARAVQVARDEVKPRKSPKWRKAVTGNLVRRFLESCKAKPWPASGGA